MEVGFGLNPESALRLSVQCKHTQEGQVELNGMGFWDEDAGLRPQILSIQVTHQPMWLGGLKDFVTGFGMGFTKVLGYLNLRFRHPNPSFWLHSNSQKFH